MDIKTFEKIVVILLLGGSGLGCGSDPDPTIPEQGIAAGTETNIVELRAEFDLDHTLEPHNINLQAYNSTTNHGAQIYDILNPDEVTPLRYVVAKTSTRFSWNSYAGRASSNKYIETGYNSNWPLPGRKACIAAQVRIDCCSYTLTEGNEGSGVETKYYNPQELYADNNSADNALSQIYATRPIYMPFTNSSVFLANGWIYNGDDKDAHGSADYLKNTPDGEDSTFEVKSVASGTVVAKFWHPWHGNVVIIEHSGANGFTYRSHYFHLRDGKTHDINKAMTTMLVGDKDDEARQRYINFANLSDPDDLHWGDETHKIKVNVGDTIGNQEHVAFSGNTGPGGAAAGLNEDGTPKDTTTANNHLHFMLSVKHATWTGDDWLYIDPYGVYEQEKSGCYELLANTEYDRFFAPFYPYFHGVDLGVFNAYLYYYGQMGRSPTTFTVQRTNNGVKASGAFKSGLSSGWYVYDYMTPGDFQTKFDELTGEPNFRLTERSVTLDGNGNPRHNGIFRPDLINNWLAHSSQNFTDYQSTFDQLTSDDYDLIDFFAYHVGNTNHVASIYAPQAGDFIHEGSLDSNTFKINANNHATNGWMPVDMNVEELSNGTFYSALYRQTGDARMMHWGMAATEYQQWMNFYLSNGWDLVMVQNYTDGTRYAAIWNK